MATANKTRLNFDLSDSYVALLERTMEACDLPTKKAVLENALVTFGWAVAQAQKERSIASMASDGSEYRELAVPALETAKMIAMSNREAASEQPLEAAE